jgi:hypothetical protein
MPYEPTRLPILTYLGLPESLRLRDLIAWAGPDTLPHANTVREAKPKVKISRNKSKSKL